MTFGLTLSLLASGMFGAGLYFSVRASSTSAILNRPAFYYANLTCHFIAPEADRYYKDVDKRFKNKVVILSNVCVGRSEERYQAKKENPKPGYDSVSYVARLLNIITNFCGQVEGMTKSQGGALENPETVVYTNDAVCPTAMVVYRLV